jgi:hypothetical protein
MADDTLDLHDAAEKMFGLLDVDAPEDSDTDETDDEGADEEELDGADSSDSEDEEDFEEADEADEEDAESEEADDEVDEEEEDDGADDNPWSATRKVKVDGEEVEVTPEEALQGYMRQQAFTKKTQALAEERKRSTEEQESLRAARQEYAAGLQKLNELLTRAAPAEPDWDKVQKGVQAEVQKAAVWQKYQNDLQKLNEEQQATLKAQQSDYEREFKQRREAEMELLLSAVPEWATDQEKAEKERRDLVQHYQSTYGYTPDELGAIVDHRAIVILRKAMLYDSLQAKKGSEKPKPKRAKTLEPGSSPPSKRTKSKKSGANKARQRLSRTGSVDDAAETLFGILE